MSAQLIILRYIMYECVCMYVFYSAQQLIFSAETFSAVCLKKQQQFLLFSRVCFYLSCYLSEIDLFFCWKSFLQCSVLSYRFTFGAEIIFRLSLIENYVYYAQRSPKTSWISTKKVTYVKVNNLLKFAICKFPPKFKFSKFYQNCLILFVFLNIEKIGCKFQIIIHRDQKMYLEKNMWMLCVHIIYYRGYESKINPNLEFTILFRAETFSYNFDQFFKPPEMAHVFVFRQTGKAWKILVKISPQRDSDQICS